MLYLPWSETYFGYRHCHDLPDTSSQEAHQGEACLGRFAAEMGCSLRELKRALRSR